MDVEETRLPGIGLRHDLVTAQGRRVGVISQRNGARHVVLYDEQDPDATAATIELTAEESEVVAELLGAPRITERLSRLREQVESLATEGVPIEPGSPYVAATLGDAAIRTRTGASVVAVVRGEEMIASPTPDFRFQVEDRLVVVGTSDGVAAVGDLLKPR
ncbi:cation:proton antiporter regulatory subunit [Modestobacter sp. VKM Ac-2978]|uniref:cation:proton antiporter regulatory subunit n=1 Tax=Modestobacter sp. VKM Ac-2978 TaxID=3004132 RepID=UPI0022AAB04D|nr:cation:proton antiporter regulatory subunit [Modestobacter sp. VKM Ac-2978]MCZ2846647.1 cation:proton antiporter regulatory subunit [Modestobacter sp. VKM Ac-2978]